MLILSQKLKIARKRMGLSQSEVATQAGISQRDVSLLENGKREFIPTEYIRFLNNKGIDVNWLFNDDNCCEDLEDELSKGEIILDRSQLSDNTKLGKKIIIVDHQKLGVYRKNIDDQKFLGSLPYLVLPRNFIDNTSCRCFQMDSDTMMETIQPFDYVIGIRNKNWRNQIIEGCIYIFVSKKEIYIHRLEKWDKKELVLSSDNDQYGPLKLFHDDVLEVWDVKSTLSFNVTSNKNKIKYILEGIQKLFEK